MYKNNLSAFLYIFLFCFIIICMIVFPGDSYNAALDGLNLWYRSVCPALLPFFICVEILIGLGFVNFIGALLSPIMRPLFKVPGEASFAFIMSIFSGYPVGAKITSKLRQEKICTKIEGQRMLSLCSTSGPLFIIGAVAVGILKSPSLGGLLAVSHYLSAITLGLILRNLWKEEKASNLDLIVNPIKAMFTHRKKDARSIGTVLGDSVKNSVNLILLVGGFIIFFSVINSALKVSGALKFISNLLCTAMPNNISQGIVASVIAGILEVTNGVKACSMLSSPMIVKICLISFMIGFGGLSVNAQVLSIVSETDLRFDIYIFFKFIQGLIASLYTYIMFRFLYSVNVFNINNIYDIKSVFSPETYNFRDMLFISLNNLLFSLGIVLFLSLFVFLIFTIATLLKRNYKS